MSKPTLSKHDLLGESEIKSSMWLFIYCGVLGFQWFPYAKSIFTIICVVPCVSACLVSQFGLWYACVCKVVTVALSTVLCDGSLLWEVGNDVAFCSEVGVVVPQLLRNITSLKIITKICFVIVSLCWKYSTCWLFLDCGVLQ